MNKCTNGKQITYTSEPCEKLGLQTAGPIKDAVTVVPVAPRPRQTPSALRQTPPKDSDEDTGDAHVERSEVSRAATIRPINPLVDKMLNWQWQR
jgi:hypothetical protein